MSTHTPGPWHSAPSDITDRFVVYGNDDNSLPCAIAPRNNRSNDESKANARLIAAAPDLLAALQALVIAADFKAKGSMLPADWGVRVKQARAAIAKAEGTS